MVGFRKIGRGPYRTTSVQCLVFGVTRLFSEVSCGREWGARGRWGQEEAQCCG